MKIYQGTIDIAGDNQLTSVKVNDKELLSRPIQFTNGNNLILKLRGLLDSSVNLQLINNCSIVQIVDKATNEDEFNIQSIRTINNRNAVITIKETDFTEVSEIDYTPVPVPIIDSKIDNGEVTRDEFEVFKSSVGDVSAKADKSYVDTQLATKASTTALAAKADQSAMTTALAGKATTASVTAKADKTYVDSQDALNAKVATTYTKSETDTLLAGKQDVA